MTSSNTPVQWEALTWEEIPAALEAASHCVLLPVGATEQHGPHLGTGVDTAIATEVCLAVSKQTRVPVLPAISIGCSLGHSRRWPGTLSVSPQTLIAMVTEMGDWLVAARVRRLIIVNAHVTNAAPLRCAVEVLRAKYDGLMCAVINTGTLSERIAAEFSSDAADWHANAAETSLMQALRPEFVREGQIATADDPDRTYGLVFTHPVNRTSRNGVTGAPSRANAEAGRRLFDWMVDDLCALTEAAMHEEPPLPHLWKHQANPL